ncbi:MAG: hypothetical protein ACUVQ0_06920 [Thermoproteota archaeon]
MDVAENRIVVLTYEFRDQPSHDADTPINRSPGKRLYVNPFKPGYVIVI